MPHPAATYRLGIVSTYLPRQCGLATYTADLREALGEATGELETVVVAIDRDGHTYGDEVVAVIDHDAIEDYSSAAHALRASGVDVALIQHEYGIFGGGEDGTHVLALARALADVGLPYVVTLHTVLSRPSEGQAATLRALCARAARVTVFTETARRVAIRTGVAAGHQLVVVPHGAPVAMRTAPATLPTHVGHLVSRVSGKPTLTTFGLLSEGKGIDVAIKALALVVRDHPETQYIVAGATHPEIKRKDGEAYRHRLMSMVEDLDLRGNVHFVDAFLSLDELSAILHASTLFVTPYRSPEQICSGALTFALGAGLPAVSSAYTYAEDMLSGGAGLVVPCGSVDALATAITGLLGDPARLSGAQAAAAHCASWLAWPVVAERTADLFRDVVVAHHTTNSLPGHTTAVVEPLNLTHLDLLTDEIGIVQFAVGAEPALASGYCVDDVARLAIVAADLLAVGPSPAQSALANQWLRQSLRFLVAAHDSTGRSVAMHNVLSYGGTWQDEPHLGDHVGRAMWALGVLAGTPAVPDEVRLSATHLLDELGPRAGALSFVGLRSMTYALLGLARAGRRADAAPLVRQLTNALAATTAVDPTWHWFEPSLTYDNARLPQALLLGARLMGDQAVAARALHALDWYGAHVGLTDGTLRCVGNQWHHRGEAPARWLADDGDEQPLDAAAVVEAYVDAWHHTGNPDHARLAGWAFAWFLGRNRAGVRLYVDETGACHDGLTPNGVNGNQGAESTLAYYQALLSLLRAGLAASPHPVGGAVPAVGRAATIHSAPARLTAGRRTRTTEGHADAS